MLFETKPIDELSLYFAILMLSIAAAILLMDTSPMTSFTVLMQSTSSSAMSSCKLSDVVSRSTTVSPSLKDCAQQLLPDCSSGGLDSFNFDLNFLRAIYFFLLIRSFFISMGAWQNPAV